MIEKIISNKETYNTLFNKINEIIEQVNHDTYNEMDIAIIKAEIFSGVICILIYFR